jgi:hypothetical protein
MHEHRVMTSADGLSPTGGQRDGDRCTAWAPLKQLCCRCVCNRVATASMTSVAAAMAFTVCCRREQRPHGPGDQSPPPSRLMHFANSTGCATKETTQHDGTMSFVGCRSCHW